MHREKLEEQKDILRQIAEASDSIRRKHRMIKLGKENVEHAMSEVFKPVVTLLQKLVNVSQTEHNTIKDKIRDEIKDEIKDNVGMNDTFETTNESFNTLKNDSTIGEISDIQDDDNDDDDDDDDDDGDDGHKNDEDLPVNRNDSMQRYLNMLLPRQNKQLSTVYGVRKLSKKKLVVGDSPISFEGDQIHIGDTSYPKTNGLIELVFRKIPNEAHVTQDDLNNYKNIIIRTNAYKKYYEPDGDIRRSKSFKFKNVITKQWYGQRYYTTLHDRS
ncbi:zinc-regulated protein 8-like [Cephus cinctus]|uniref:Zinc-regulated protein 8-like n=1 Tax=Cephus cinctus TaxID=211228 RepID=A0AAJ7C2E1_CEPCN|nr:zinc-regulated protein 8-like [Cephus cinctus]